MLKEEEYKKEDERKPTTRMQIIENFNSKIQETFIKQVHACKPHLSKGLLTIP